MPAENLRSGPCHKGEIHHHANSREYHSLMTVVASENIIYFLSVARYNLSKQIKTMSITMSIRK